MELESETLGLRSERGTKRSWSGYPETLEFCDFENFIDHYSVLYVSIIVAGIEQISCSKNLRATSKMRTCQMGGRTSNVIAESFATGVRVILSEQSDRADEHAFQRIVLPRRHRPGLPSVRAGARIKPVISAVSESPFSALREEEGIKLV
ncbi:hypothetical protein KM043_008181 [Ampulex compressa]|nr:hypothetical protein KM043_008181 [Ampulex compressa]